MCARVRVCMCKAGSDGRGGGGGREDRKVVRPEEQSEKAKSCRANLWNEIQSNGP